MERRLKEIKGDCVTREKQKEIFNKLSAEMASEIFGRKHWIDPRYWFITLKLKKKIRKTLQIKKRCWYKSKRNIYNSSKF